LTRVNQGSNFATDVAVFMKGTDPATGVRYLEELSFEVVNEQSASDVRDKAEDLIRRGVRRVFAIFIKKGQVAEWSRGKQDWEFLPANAVLTDNLFIRPISVGALLDAAVAEMEVAKALWQKENPVLKEIVEQSHNKGFDEGHNKGFDEGHNKGFDEGQKEGHNKGFDEGQKEGWLKAHREVLLGLLEDKFGTLLPEIANRIQNASVAEVRGWTKTILRANTVAEVFAVAIK
jgi:hypothetical protein